MENKDFLYLLIWGVVIWVVIEWYPPLGWSLALVAGALMISRYKGL
jgi:hypothetical protein